MAEFLADMVGPLFTTVVVLAVLLGARAWAKHLDGKYTPGRMG